MRHFFFFLLLTGVGCTAPPNHQRPTPIDTAALFDPYPTDSSELDLGAVFSNCLMVDEDSLDVVINQERQYLKDKKAVRDFLQRHAPTIRQRRFYILYRTGTTFQQLVELVAMVKSFQIDNYRVVNPMPAMPMNEPRGD